MKISSSTEFTARDGRRFGVQVGIAFAVLGALLLWRDRIALASIGGALSGLLILGGLLIPGRLGPVYRSWMAVALAISRITTPIFMAVVYYLVLTPTGLVMRAVGRNPLRRSGDGGTDWIWRTRGNHGDMRRQF
ncbi:MAG: SxtJ family membrane protein [Gemmatimonadota bacterium]|nr:SxtJ family membrane protein [Gemmatimonadota bacterium]MDH3427253.1 SxtJ family membrane protein [Gemmatimonadota bacterium]